MRANTNTTEPEAVIKPEATAVLIETLLKTGSNNLVLMGFFGLFLGLVTNEFVLSVGVAAGVLLLVTILQVWWVKRRIKNVEYRVYDNHIESKHGVFSTTIEIISYDDMTSVSRTQSFVEKRYGLGRVNISTTGSDGTTLSMNDIPDHEHWYEFIRDRHQETTPGSSN